MEGTCAVETVKGTDKRGPADRKKPKVDKQFYEIHVALEKHGLKEDIEKIRKIYGMQSVREFPHILNESILKKFGVTGTLQQYNEIYRDTRKAAQMIGDDSMPAWELFSESELIQQEEIRVECQGSSKAFCAICKCIKTRCVEKDSHFGIGDSSPPRLNCFYCAGVFSGVSRFIHRERHQMLRHFTR